MTAGEIAERFPLARSTLSGHFNILKNAGLIVAEKNGTSIVYSLNVSVVEQTMAAVMDLFDVGKPQRERSHETVMACRADSARSDCGDVRAVGVGLAALPERVPVHWNLPGEVDRLGSRLEGAAGDPPIVACGIYALLMRIVPLVDPGRRNYENFAKAFNAIRIAIVLSSWRRFYAVIVADGVWAGNVDMNTVVLGRDVARCCSSCSATSCARLRPNWLSACERHGRFPANFPGTKRTAWPGGCSC